MTARYQQLADILRAAIIAGDYRPGDTLPTHADLAATHGLARPTVREAIRVLEAEGLVQPIRKRGTVVLDQRPIRIHLSRYTAALTPGGALGPFETACQAAGVEGRMQPVEVELEEAEPGVAAALGLGDHAPVIRRTRIALVVGEPVPVQLHTAWYPRRLAVGAPALLQPGRIAGGIYRALIDAGFEPATIDEEVAARMPTAGERAELGLRGEPVFHIDRITRDAQGTPLELLQIVANSRRTTLVYDNLPLSR